MFSRGFSYCCQVKLCHVYIVQNILIPQSRIKEKMESLNLMKLPDEMLVEILSFVPKKTNVFQVCRKLKEISEREFGHKLIINRDDVSCCIYWSHRPNTLYLFFLDCQQPEESRRGSYIAQKVHPNHHRWLSVRQLGAVSFSPSCDSTNRSPNYKFKALGLQNFRSGSG